MEIAIIALGAIGLVFAGIALKRARPNLVAERVPGHPDTFELRNEGPGTAVVVHADVVSAANPQGASIAEAGDIIPGVWIDERIRSAGDDWGKGSILTPLRQFEVRLPAATRLRLVYRAEGLLGSIATATLVVEGSHRSDSAPNLPDH